jgi:hypothetical protein
MISSISSLFSSSSPSQMSSVLDHSQRIRLENVAFSAHMFCEDYAPDNSGTIIRPNGQRLLAPSWSANSKKGRGRQVKFIDSVFHGYPIPTILLNRIRSQRLYEVYDGRHRIETLWNFYNDKFKYKGKLYSELCEEDKRTFCERTIPVTITTDANNLQLAEVFIRVNAGAPLKDFDLLWANRESNLVKAVHALVVKHPRLSTALGGIDMNNRNDLANWAAFVAGLSTQNAGNFTTSYTRLSGDEHIGLDLEVNEAAVRQGLDAFSNLMEAANVAYPALASEQKKYKKAGRIAAFFFAEWMPATPEQRPAVHSKWLEIIGRLRGPKNDATAMSAALHTTGAQNLTSSKVEQTLQQVNAFLAGAPGHVIIDSESDSDSDD